MKSGSQPNATLWRRIRDLFRHGLLPRWSPFERTSVRIRPDADGFTVTRGDGRGTARLSATKPEKATIARIQKAQFRYLELPDEMVLQTKALLPAGVGSKLRDAIALRMPELTPFDEEEVLFDVGPPTPVSEDRISVPIFVTPRKAVDEQRSSLRDLGIRVDGVIAADAGEAPAGMVPVFLADRLHTRARGRLILFVASLLALVISAGFFHVRVSSIQTEAATELTQRLGTLRGELARASELEAEIEALTTSLTRPSSRHREQSLLLDVLDEVAAILPDDSYLSSFRWEKDRASISGLSADAAALLKKLEVSDSFSDVKFSSPVSQDRREGKDRFTIVFRLDPRERRSE